MRKTSIPGPDGRLYGWDAIFNDCRKAVARVVARIVKPNEIEDIVQETYLRIFQASQRHTIHHPKSFMLKAARNIALNHVTRVDAMNHLESLPAADDGEHEEIAFESAAYTESPEVRAQAEQELLVFCEAIRELPLQCRRAFILKKIHGLSQKEIAIQLNISEKTVEKHIAKGIVICSAHMTSRGYARNAKQKRSAHAGGRESE